MRKQILVKTLIGKGKLHQLLTKEIIISNNVSKTLGCWIINLEYQVVNNNEITEIKGKYDIQLWYAENENQNSNVYVENVSFDEKIKMNREDSISFNDEGIYKVFVDKYPMCNHMELKEDKRIILEIESIFIINEFKDTLINVECDEIEEDTLPLEEEIVMNVNPNYLLKKDDETNNN